MSPQLSTHNTDEDMITRDQEAKGLHSEGTTSPRDKGKLGAEQILILKKRDLEALEHVGMPA